MNTNFILSYNEGKEYINLYPRTKIENINLSDRALKLGALEVDVPAFEDLVQSIPLTITETLKEAPFYVELLSEGLEAEKAYSTIDQVEIKNNNLLITRLRRPAKTDIKIILRFKEGIR